MRIRIIEMKKSTTVEQQLAKLQDRGMLIDIPNEKAIDILSDIGYFRLGFYCFPFEISYPEKKLRKHKYKEGTKFSDVVALYYFDVDLRNILLKYLNRIEINFRTNIIYRVSNQYIDCNIWFVSPFVMEKNFIEKFDKELYTENFKKNPIIKHHHSKYINDKYAPAWKTLEFFTFGAMIRLYNSLKDNILKQEISLQYNVRKVKTFEFYLRALVELRNLCAHGNVLFNHKLMFRLPDGVALQVKNNKNNDRLYSVIKVMYYILKNISENREKDMRDEINMLFKKFDNNEIIKDLISNETGFKNEL